MSLQDHPPPEDEETDDPHAQEMEHGGWDDETLVDKLDVSIQFLQVLDDLFQAKVQAGEGLTQEELSRANTVLTRYIRDYAKARAEWLNVVS